MAGFRVVCDLSDYFRDVRSKAFLYIDLSKVRIVKDLTSRIQDTFNLNFCISLALNGLYLPDSEDIRVLQNNDEVKVIKTDLVPTTTDSTSYDDPTTLNSSIEKNGHSAQTSINIQNHLRDRESIQIKSAVLNKLAKCTESAIGECFGENDSKYIKKCNVSENGNTLLVGSNRRKRKNTESVDDNVNASSTIMLLELENDVQNIDAVVKKKREKKSKQKRISNDKSEEHVMLTSIKPMDSEAHPDIETASTIPTENFIENMELKKTNTFSDEQPGEDCECKDKKKRKRTRCRTRKRKKIEFQPIEDPILLNGINYANVMSNCVTASPANSIKKHVRYEENLEIDFTEDLLNSHKSVQTGHLLDGKQSNDTCQLDEIETDQREVSVSLPSCNDSAGWCSTTAEKNYSSNMPFDKILSLRNSIPIVVKRTKASPLPLNDSSVPQQALLQNIPAVNEIISFKVLKLGENYCPQLSSPITAKVIECDTVTQQLTLKVLDGADQCQEPQGKFSINSEIENAPEPVDIVRYNWQELIGPYALSQFFPE